MWIKTTTPIMAISLYWPPIHAAGLPTAEYFKTIEKLQELLRRAIDKNAHIILGGDLNMCIKQHDSINDRGTLNTINQRLLELLDTFGLVDAFRHYNQNTRSYTYPRTNPSARLDYIFVSRSLLPFINNVTHFEPPGALSDHLAVKIEITNPMLCDHTALRQQQIALNKARRRVIVYKAATREMWQKYHAEIAQKMPRIMPVETNLPPLNQG
jgi:exonuclease III